MALCFVVLLPPARVRERAIGFVEQLETLGRYAALCLELIPLLAVSGGDVDGRRVLRHPQDLVVSSRHG